MTRKSRSKHAQRYPYFLKWENPDEIPTKELANQWGIKPQVVYSMIGVAKRNPNIFELFLRQGYAEEQIPAWIKRPENLAEVQSEKGGGSSVHDAAKVEENEAGSEGSVRDGDGSAGLGRVVHVAPNPKLDVSSERQEQDITVLDDAQAQPNGASSGQPEPGGPSTGITDLNVDAAGPSKDEDFVERVIKDVVVRELTIRTEAIMKKIALNPTVFLCYNYLSSAKDPRTGLPIFEGDLADFLNHCVRFTMDKGYGVKPVIMTGRPSLLQLLKEHERRQEENQNFIPLW